MRHDQWRQFVSLECGPASSQVVQRAIVSPQPTGYNRLFELLPATIISIVRLKGLRESQPRVPGSATEER